MDPLIKRIKSQLLYQLSYAPDGMGLAKGDFGRRQVVDEKSLLQMDKIAGGAVMVLRLDSP